EEYIAISGIYSFFFQAKAGIRYFHVTGVQTCALPISATIGLVSTAATGDCTAHRIHSRPPRLPSSRLRIARAASVTGAASTSNRSEERRVGKERQSRRSRSRQYTHSRSNCTH